jgi:hypothetical protein
MSEDYIEVHFEDVVQKPRETLARLAVFMDHNLDYERIQQNAQGTLLDRNSSFRNDDQKNHGQNKDREKNVGVKTEQRENESNPIGRWKALLSEAEIAEVESLIGDLLHETGYALTSPEDRRRRTLPMSLMSFLYPIYFDVKLWLKTYTPLARMGEIARMGISDPPRSNAESGLDSRSTQASKPR